MIKKSTMKRFVNFSAIAAAVVLATGSSSLVHAQRDPFAKPGFMRPKTDVAKGKPGTGAPGTPENYGPPAIETRIEYFKHLRETAAVNGAPLPKVTSVLTLNEMAVTGIFKTPRGYAAMVEATPIKLSYTIYPGEKFFDGQLVAVEENRLVFRKVTKTGPGKFVASVENKPLKEYSQKAQIEGTAPSEPSARPIETASNVPSEKSSAKDGKTGRDVKPASNPFASPLDEMEKQPAALPETGKAKKSAKKPAKVASNKGE